jgi:OOP family OmpA-OmpF porin
MAQFNAVATGEIMNQSRKSTGTTKRRLIPALVLMSLACSAHALTQSEADVLDVRTDDGPIPYVLASGKLVHSGGTRCVRTGYWTVEMAKTVRFKENNTPIGCFCEPELLPTEVCSPPVATPAPIAAPAAPAPAVAAPPVLAPVPAAEKVNVPADALFAYDKAELTDIGRDKLGAFASSLKNINLEVVTAIGHADRIGSDNYNQKLSEKRANSVKDFLIGQGIPANRIYTEGKGKSQPVSGDACKKMGPDNKRNRKLIDCLAVDRRVELEAVGTRSAK